MLKPVSVGHAFANENELLRHAGSLAGHTSGELAASLGKDDFNYSPISKGKTGVGALVEHYLGKLSDNQAHPDFAELGVELKTLPMKPRARSWTVKEPTSITLINYNQLVNQEWQGAGVRRKIARILWVPYEHHFADKRKAVFRKAFYWSPPESDWTIFEVDYNRVRNEVLAGRAHELSERMCAVLSPRRKGAKGSLTTQPFSPHRAKTRAWAFKAPYTRPILERYVLSRPFVSLVQDIRAITSLLQFEEYVTGRLGRFEGMSLAEIGKEYGATITGGKSGPATFVRKLLGIKARGAIEEFEKLGVRIHTVWASPSNLKPWEAVSFPAMSLREFASETWEESELQDHLDKILFIPLWSERRNANLSRRLGCAFFWNPSPGDWTIIRKEWEFYQGLVKSGGAQYRFKLDEEGRRMRDRRGRFLRQNSLPGYSKTQRIHIRPHGRDAKDTDVDPFGHKVTRQSFWLNPSYLRTILMSKERASAERPRLDTAAAGSSELG